MALTTSPWLATFIFIMSNPSSNIVVDINVINKAKCTTATLKGCCVNYSTFALKKAITTRLNINQTGVNMWLVIGNARYNFENHKKLKDMLSYQLLKTIGNCKKNGVNYKLNIMYEVHAYLYAKKTKVGQKRSVNCNRTYITTDKTIGEIVNLYNISPAEFPIMVVTLNNLHANDVYFLTQTTNFHKMSLKSIYGTKLGKMQYESDSFSVEFMDRK